MSIICIENNRLLTYLEIIYHKRIVRFLRHSFMVERSVKVLRSVETLRIISALIVVLAHTNGLSIRFVGRFLNVNYFLGSIGVDIFFVISGFVMYLSMLKSEPGRVGATKFFINRIVRIFPLYILVTFVYAYKIHILDLEHVQQLFKSLILVPTLKEGRYIDPILVLGWTLRFELYFYGLVAVGIFLHKKIIIPCSAIILSVCFWYFFNFYFGAPIVLEFLFGYLIGFWYLKHHPLQKRSWRAVLGLLCSIAFLLLASRGRDWGESSIGGGSVVTRMWIEYSIVGYKLTIVRFIAWGIPAALLLYYSIRLENTFKWRLASLGQYTYSVYLLQVFTTSIPQNLKNRYPDLVLLALSLAVLLALAYIVHNLYDIKIRQQILRLGNKKK